MNMNKDKVVIGIVSKNITVEEFYNWSWQRISDGIRYSINKNGGLVLGLLPQTVRKEFNKEDESEFIDLSEQEKKIMKLMKLLN